MFRNFLFVDLADFRWKKSWKFFVDGKNTSLIKTKKTREILLLGTPILSRSLGSDDVLDAGLRC